MLGDLHYSGHSGFSPEQFKYSMLESLSFSPQQKALYQNLPWSYILDDHDTGKNNCDSKEASVKMSKMIYEEISPNPNQQSAYDLSGVRFI